MTSSESTEVYHALRSIMAPLVKSLDIKRDDQGGFYVDTYYVMKNKKPLYFGVVKINKNYVSYHLMPVYTNPSLLDDMSEDLGRRMQGKSCFNFKSIDKKLFKELRALTKRGLEEYRSKGYLEAVKP